MNRQFKTKSPSAAAGGFGTNGTIQTAYTETIISPKYPPCQPAIFSDAWRKAMMNGGAVCWATEDTAHTLLAELAKLSLLNCPQDSAQITQALKNTFCEMQEAAYWPMVGELC